MNNYIKDVFINNGYVIIKINDKEIFYKNNNFYRIDYVDKWKEYVIEYTNSLENAKKNLFEDSEFITENLNKNEINNIIINLLNQ